MTPKVILCVFVGLITLTGCIRQTSDFNTALSDTTDLHERLMAAERLSAAESNAVCKRLLQVLDNSDHSVAALNAVTILGEIGDARVADELAGMRYRALQQNDEGKLNRAFIEAVQHIKTRTMPNHVPDPTSPSVTPPAGAGGVPSVATDH
jgi:hypothetical protein